MLVLKNKIAPEDKWVECTNETCGYSDIRKNFKAADPNVQCPKCGTTIELENDASQEVYSYFVDVVIQDVAKEMAKKDGIEKWDDDIWQSYLDRINRGGYHIYATLDAKVQNQIDKIYKNLKNIPKTRSAQQLQSAIVVVDNSTGDIVGMAGGVGEQKAHFGQNRATKSKLQSGSSIKPLAVYAPGFQKGVISPATVIRDMPSQYKGGSPWPKNAERRYSYSRTILGGIEDSVNAVAANTLTKIGISYGYDFAKNSFNLTTLRAEDEQIAALALGAQYYGVTVRDMTAAFATFANKGVYREARTWTKVYDSRGNMVLSNDQDSKEILNYCLTNAVTSGTGAGANFASGYVAGKTGTTSSSRDRWFCGYTSRYTAAVWCGYDLPEKINLSSNPAVTLWRKVMQPIHSGLSKTKLYSTSKMSRVTVCLDSGKLATDACTNDVRGNRTQSVYVYAQDRPSKACDKHVSVSYCVGNGVANQYCSAVAAKNSKVTVANKGLLKLTQSEINELNKLKRFGLNEMFLRDDYVYLITSDGKDGKFKGFTGTINAGISAPYKVCTVHNESSVNQGETPEIGDTVTN